MSVSASCKCRRQTSRVLSPTLTEQTRSHQVNYAHALSDANTAKTEVLARAVLLDITEEYRRYGAGSAAWIYGDATGPTMLDAHVVTLLARLFDNNRHDLVPPELERYGKAVMEGPLWKSVTHGRPTNWNPSLGHVRNLNPL